MNVSYENNNGVHPSTIITTHYKEGGSFQYLKHLADAFRRVRYPISFYLPENTDISGEGNIVCRYFLTDPSVAPGIVKVKPLKYLFHLSQYVYNSLIIRPERHANIVHLLFPFYLTDWLTVDRLKNKGIKVVLTVHNVLPHKFLLGGGLDRKLSGRMFHRADMLLVHTESLKDTLVGIYATNPQKIHVVPHGYFGVAESPAETAALRKKYGIPHNKKVLLFFGAIRGNKGLDVLLHAMRYLPTDFFLLIAGDAEGASETPVDYYEDIIAAHDLITSVFWIKKYLPAGETSEVFKIADAVVLPYKKSFYAQSGVLNLAVGYEKPSVVSDVGGMGETVKEYNLGTVVESENPRALVEGILTLFRRPDRKTDFDFARYKKVNNWDSVVEKLISLYNDLVRNEPS
jgi:glycosyltransferase involved in cell wall biosynthesis